MISRFILITILSFFSVISLKAQSGKKDFLKGKESFKLENYTEAQNHFLKSIDEGYKEAKVYQMLADCYYVKDSFNIALKYISKSIDLEFQNSTSHLIKAKAFLGIDSLQPAIKELNIAYNINPNDYRALSLRGFTFGELGQNKNAINDLTKVINNDKADENDYYNRGLYLLKSGDFIESESDLKKSLSLKSNYIRSISLLAVNYDLQNKLDSAESYINKGFKIDSNDFVLIKTKCSILKKRGETEKLLSFLEEIIPKFPNSNFLINSRASSNNHIKNYKLALNDYDYLVKEKYKLKNTYLNRGLLLIKMKKNEQACLDLNKAKSLGDSTSELLLGIYCN